MRRSSADDSSLLDGFDLAIRGIRDLQQAAQSKWFPNEKIEETERRLTYKILVASVDGKPMTDEDLIKAAESAHIGELPIGAGVNFYCWAISLAFLRNAEKSIRDASYGRAVNGLTMASAMAALAVAAREDAALTVVELARKAANARHAPGRERKARVLEWYSDNRGKYRSMDAAAEVAARKFSVAFRTARDYIGEFRKQERSARKA